MGSDLAPLMKPWDSTMTFPISIVSSSSALFTSCLPMRGVGFFSRQPSSNLPFTSSGRMPNNPNVTFSPITYVRQSLMTHDPVRTWELLLDRDVDVPRRYDHES